MFALKEASALAREPEVAAVIDALDRYLGSASGPQKFRQSRNAPDGTNEAAAYRGLADLGLTRVILPEDKGGYGFAPGIAALVGERLGWSLAVEPLVENIVLPSALLEALGRAPAEEITCVAWQEGPFALPGNFPLRTVASREPGGIRVRGTKAYVMGARASARMLVLASMEGSPAIVSVPSEKASRNDKALADGTCWSEVTFDALVEMQAVIGGGDSCVRALAYALDLSNLALAGLLYGLQSRILAMTLEYLGTREQFGRPLGAFQALQHRAVDLYMHSQIARYLIGEAVDATGPSVSPQTLAAYASRAKARTVDSAQRIAKEGIQMHGAIGFSDEYDLGLYVKRILVLSAWLGGAVWHRRRHAALDTADLAA